MQVTIIRRPWRRRLILGPGALLTGALLAGCGHGAAANQAASTTSSNKQADALKFAQCMRSHGVNIPDPQSVGSGGAGFAIRVTPGAGDQALNPDSAQFQQAQNACKSLLPNGGELSPEQQAQAQANALKFAQCMRAHGVDVPDPKPGASGLRIQAGGAGGKVGVNGVNPDDPKFQAAQSACQGLLGNPITVGGNSGLSKSGG